MDIKELVTKYIALRDKKAEIMNEAKERAAKLDHALGVAEGALLAFFNEHAMDSVSCNAGTAYRTTRTSATVADWDAMLAFVQEKEAWHMLERRVSKTAVEEYVSAEGDLPPGVNWKSDVTINVRRA